MRARVQTGKRIVFAFAMLVLAFVPVFAQNHKNDAPRPSREQRSESRPQPHYEAPRPPRQYQPPAQGHHSGQWLSQHRGESPEQQRQALRNDRDFRRLPPDRQQKFEQRLQRFNSLPPERQERVLQRMETWEHLTQQQKQTFRNTESQFRSLPPDRRQAVKNAIESLRAMPPQARQRAIESGRFNQFSPQERQVLNDAAQLPLAPADSAPQPEPPRTGPQRYIPRPPH